MSQPNPTNTSIPVPKGTMIGCKSAICGALNRTNGAWISIRATSVLDNNYPYVLDVPTAEDSPGYNINSPYCASRILQVTNSFTMWLLFMPTNGPAGSIVGQWTPLRLVNWNMTGQGFLAETNCQMSDWRGTNFMNNSNPLDSGTLQYPSRTNNIRNFHFQPE